ncbi:MAG: cytochrome C oxidase subunit IV family protein [Gemmatimonadaceae bacterium]
MDVDNAHASGQPPPPATPAQATVDDAPLAHPAHQAGHDAEHAGDHPDWSTYKWVALILTAITIVEVWIYYIPTFVASRAFVPSLLIMSAVKFAIVVMFYMHLKYDHKIFRALFVGPLLVAVSIIIGLMLLFGQVVIRLGR